MTHETTPTPDADAPLTDEQTEAAAGGQTLPYRDWDWINDIPADGKGTGGQ